MTTRLNPYIGFRDTASEAMTFYQSVFGGELVMNTFADFHASEDPAELDKIMHAMLITEGGLVLMASDTPASMDVADTSNITISLSGEDGAELRAYWDALTTQGTVVLPLEKAPWGDSFGMCVDKFAINWMVNIIGG
ncbi:MAG: protein PhnB [Nocardioidaceae bacterium]|nr:protein PhnB [Nocardioidaceae bacterium]